MTFTRNPDNTCTVDTATLEQLAELAFVDELRTLSRPFHSTRNDKQARVQLAQQCAEILGYDIRERIDSFTGKFTDTPDQPRFIEWRQRLYEAFEITASAV